MLNFAKVCCLCVAVALILAVSAAPTHAGLSTNCVAAHGSDTSLLLQIKKQKKHHDGQSQNDTGLTECTIVQPGGGGGCKTGFKYVCDKMKSGNKCCGCVVDPNAPPVQIQKTCCVGTFFQGATETGCGSSEAEAKAAIGRKRPGSADSYTCTPQ